MKTSQQLPAKIRVLRAMASGLVWLNATVTTQTFTTVKSFGILTAVTGFNPRCQLVQGPDGTPYGNTSSGESSVAGTAFKIQPDGSGFAVLKWFANSVEGQSPGADLSFSGNLLYGTTISGANSNAGTVFKMSTDGTGFAGLKHITGSDGANPRANLILSAGVLYGTTS